MGGVVRGEITEIRGCGDGEVLSRKVSGSVFFGGCSQEDWQTNISQLFHPGHTSYLT